RCAGIRAGGVRLPLEGLRELAPGDVLQLGVRDAGLLLRLLRFRLRGVLLLRLRHRVLLASSAAPPRLAAVSDPDVTVSQAGGAVSTARPLALSSTLARVKPPTPDLVRKMTFGRVPGPRRLA